MTVTEVDDGGEAAAPLPQTAEEMEVEISRRVQTLASDFKSQADSLTLGGVRRALEKDMGLETFSLDAHKRFIKSCVEQFIWGDNDDDKSPALASSEVNPVMEEDTKLQEVHPLKDQGNNGSVHSGEEMGSPVSDEKQPAEGENGLEENGVLSESIIKKAIKKRAAYFAANSTTISLNGARQLLAEDLNVEKSSLNAYKTLIKEEIEKIIISSEENVISDVKKKNAKKVSEKVDSDKKHGRLKKATENLESSNSDDDLGEDDASDSQEEKRSTKRTGRKIKESSKHVKRPNISSFEKGSKSSASKKRKSIDLDVEKSTVAGSEKSSESEQSLSSADDGPKKKIEKPAQPYGKQVENLKSIIKSCGMGVPPAIYKRVKQAPESKREALLIKELEKILEKEGLSSKPSEKEIKAVKKRKQTAKELEGIDLSNIVSSSRRRSTSSYLPPPKPKVEVEPEEDEDEEDEDEDADEDEDEDGDDEVDDANREDSNDGRDDAGDASEVSDKDAGEGSE